MAWISSNQGAEARRHSTPSKMLPWGTGQKCPPCHLTNLGYAWILYTRKSPHGKLVYNSLHLSAKMRVLWTRFTQLLIKDLTWFFYYWYLIQKVFQGKFFTQTVWVFSSPTLQNVFLLCHCRSQIFTQVGGCFSFQAASVFQAGNDGSGEKKGDKKPKLLWIQAPALQLSMEQDTAAVWLGFRLPWLEGVRGNNSQAVNLAIVVNQKQKWVKGDNFVDQQFCQPSQTAAKGGNLFRPTPKDTVL